MKAYIDSYEIITLLLEKDIKPNNKKFYLVGENGKTPLEIVSSYEERDNNKFLLKFVHGIELHKDYTIIDEENNSCMLYSGGIVRTPQFELEYQYDGPLGVEYTKKYSIFRIWSPVAKEIYIDLCIDNKNEKHFLKYVNDGLWEIKVYGDLEGASYLYHVRVFEEFSVINDPYAISSSTNGNRNYIIDTNKLYKIVNKKPEFSGRYTDAVIYEASVRDFSYGIKTEELKGTFKGFMEEWPDKKGPGSTGLEYIAELGITHLQLLPLFDFEEVDDIKKNTLYNWGYNPFQYFIPCGWYSTDPEDPYTRINEMLEFIDECHKKNIRVVMDVVYNHVYKYEVFAFDTLCPGYFYRVDNMGNMSNATGCGNDLATEKYMTSRFIVDNLLYYARMFNISGFRFDLMGLLDIDTLNKAREELLEIEPNIILYGEGWNMVNPLPDEKRPHMYNYSKVPGYAFFNDKYRDFVRGSQWNKTPGYAYSGDKNHYDTLHLLMGSCINYYKFGKPTQTVNYVECHDNYTFYDFGKYSLSYDEKHVTDACKIALQMVIISEGIPFIHGGEEFFRTKMGIENSYKSKDSINRIDYKRRDKYLDNVNSIIDLIKIRKEYDVFRFDNPEDIERYVHHLDGLTDNNTFGMLYESKNENLIVIIKKNRDNRSIVLENSTMIFDTFKKCEVSEREYSLNNVGVYIFKKEKTHDYSR